MDIAFLQAFPFTISFQYNNIINKAKYFLRGQVKFLTGGDEAIASKSVTRLTAWLNGGSGETPGPTVKVWMGEGKKVGFEKG